MTLEYLVSAVNQEETLPEKMHLDADAIVINQGRDYAFREYESGGHWIRFFSMPEKGVGLSRNTALQRAEGDIILFADEDIVYAEGAAEKVLRAFSEHPEADMLLFNVEVTEERRTYRIDSFRRVHRYNCGRYPAYSFALRLRKARECNLSYHLWFGGGARFSNGEDSLFINDSLKAGFKVYAVPVTIGEEIPRPSTWFHGYNEKFFYDRGVLYHYLYGRLAPVMGLRFLLRGRDKMFGELSFAEAKRQMKLGYRLGKEAKE